MATAGDIVRRAFQLIGIVGEGEEPSAEMSSDGLESLNDMVEAWANESLLLYQVQFETFTWPSGQSSRTIGSGGNFDTVRPLALDPATFIRIASTDYTLDVLDHAQYAAIPDKTSAGSQPELIHLDRTYPLANLYVWPVPDQSVELHLATLKQLTAFAGLTTSVSLPPGYKRLLRFNLALELAPEYGGASVSPEVLRIAKESKAKLKSTNSVPPQIVMDTAVPGTYRDRTLNIYTGGA